MNLLEALREVLRLALNLPPAVSAALWAEQVRLARGEQPLHAGAAHAAINSEGRVIGEHHHRAKLSDSDVDLILGLREAGLSYAQIAAKFDDDRRIARSTVAAVCTGHRRSQTTFGHRRVHRQYVFGPAHPDEFDIVVH